MARPLKPSSAGQRSRGFNAAVTTAIRASGLSCRAHRNSRAFAVLCGMAMRSATSAAPPMRSRSEEHTSELQSNAHLVCRLLLETKTRLLIKQGLQVEQVAKLIQTHV